MDIPKMSARKDQSIQIELGEVWKDAMWKDFENNGIEQINAAIENGDVDPDGVPFITVLLDGGWSKRSYVHSYDVASGVAIIIGRRTGKLLFLGVRNKYCSVCTRAGNRQEQTSVHVCYKNWSGSSGAAEADIIVEGFSRSVAMHGVRYKTFIADGDSSVFHNIKNKVEYGLEVEKLECTNHVMKNYGKFLLKLKNDTTNVALQIRAALPIKVIKRLTKAAKQAIYNNAQGSLESLRADMRNMFSCFQ